MGELSKLPNVGKTVEEQLIQVGISSVDELRRAGAKSAWLKIQEIDESACINRLMALQTAKEWAKDKGAAKLYILSHSSIESQAFYKAMGYVEAEVYCQKHVEEEPCDCQLECALQM